MSERSYLEKLLGGVEVEWKALEDVARIMNGYAFESSKYVSDGIRVIRISDVQKGKMSNENLKFYPFDSKEEISRYLLCEGDLVMSLTGNVGRVAMLSSDDLPAGLNQRVACIRSESSIILTRYLFHYFDQISFENEAMSSATGGGQKNLSTRWLSAYQIPIPPLHVQKEIVRILDTFTELTTELTNRKKQYNHYRDQLLGFEEGRVEWKTLGEISEYSQSRISSLDVHTENYVGVDNLLPNRGGKTDSNYVPTSGNLTAYLEGDILIGNIRPYLKKIWHADRRGGTNGDVLVIHPSDQRVLSRYLFQILADEKFFAYNMQHAKGAKMPRGSKPKIMEYKIPIPYPDNPEKSLAEQARIVAILDKFDTLTHSISEGLPREIELRQKQYAHYRDLLLSFPKPETEVIA